MILPSISHIPYPTFIPIPIPLLTLRLTRDCSIKKAVRDDVAYLKGHELIHPGVKAHISGWIYHVETGKVEKVV